VLSLHPNRSYVTEVIFRKGDLVIVGDHFDVPTYQRQEYDPAAGRRLRVTLALFVIVSCVLAIEWNVKS